LARYTSPYGLALRVAPFYHGHGCWRPGLYSVLVSNSLTIITLCVISVLLTIIASAASGGTGQRTNDKGHMPMNIYRITVREVCSTEYSIEADTEEEARDLLYMGDQQPQTSYIDDFEITQIEEYK
jgi:nitrate/nitrite-specific signal transduction histidine kinase